MLEHFWGTAQVFTRSRPVVSHFTGLAKLWYEDVPPCCGACFFHQAAELGACIVVFVIDVGSNPALGIMVADWIGWHTALMPFATFVLTHHGSCADG